MMLSQSSGVCGTGTGERFDPGMDVSEAVALVEETGYGKNDDQER